MDERRPGESNECCRCNYSKHISYIDDTLPANYKARVSNIAVLEGHELNVEGGSKVDAMIQALSTSAPNQFIENVKEARKGYDSLSAANKKAVALVNELKAQEKIVKTVQKVIDEIEGLSNPKNN